MVIEYNGRKKSNANRLFINKLYAKENSIFKDIEDEQMEDLFDDDADDRSDETDEDIENVSVRDPLDKTDE